MKKGHNKVTFKIYTMDQPSLLPQSQEELIPEDHLVRVVNRVMDGLDLGRHLPPADRTARGRCDPHCQFQVQIDLHEPGYKLPMSTKRAVR
jgi:hypothetical protein